MSGIRHIGLLLFPLAATVIWTPRVGAQIGRFPVLAPLPKDGKCGHAATTAELKKQGIDSTFTFDALNAGRNVSVSTDNKRHPVLMTAFAGVQVNKRSETEYAMIFFKPTGLVLRGARTYSTSGTPSNASEERRSGLLKPDSALARQLAAQVVQRCARSH
jgi:hypothetical protein